MSSRAYSGLTTDASTDDLSTSQTSFGSTVQPAATATAYVTTTESSVSTADTTVTPAPKPRSIYTSTVTTGFTAITLSSGTSTNSAVNTTRTYPTTADVNSGHFTSSGNMTSVLYGSSGTTSSSNISTSSTNLPLSSNVSRSSFSTNAAKRSRKSATTGVMTANRCPDPLAITGGKLLSRGPYLANVSSAIYSCLAGYTLTGQAEIGCSVAGTWDVQPPKCVPINKPNVDNHISLEDSTRVPLWLTVILCIAFGLLCLLLLACLLVYCLKIFGCWKGSAIGTKLVVRESGVESGDQDRGRMNVDNFGPTGKYNRPTHISHEENDEGLRRPRDQPYSTSSRIPLKSTAQGGNYGIGPYNQYSNRRGNFQHERGKSNSHKPIYDDIFYRREMEEGKSGYTPGRPYRREAKMPANQTWMPHSRKFRSINTSTK